MTDAGEEYRPLILTARLDAMAQAHFDALRAVHFPPARNFLKAHVTLFHHLPDAAIASVLSTLRDVAATHAAMPATASAMRFLGNGVAVVIDCPPLLALHRTLAQGWDDWLTPQDRQGFRPHVTIQNKVQADTARALFDQLGENFTPQTLSVEGLDLWHYCGGPWEAAGGVAFASG